MFSYTGLSVENSAHKSISNRAKAMASVRLERTASISQSLWEAKWVVINSRKKLRPKVTKSLLILFFSGKMACSIYVV